MNVMINNIFLITFKLQHWASSLPTLVEHHADNHQTREPLTFMCGGCARVCVTVEELKEHLEEEAVSSARGFPVRQL